jgi:hypothetical protein
LREGERVEADRKAAEAEAAAEARLAVARPLAPSSGEVRS